jgi:hypothetical protein
VLEANPRLAGLFDFPPNAADELIRHNAGAVAGQFSSAATGKRLVELYGRVAAEGRSAEAEPLDGAAGILDAFLALERFRLLRS